MARRSPLLFAWLLCGTLDIAYRIRDRGGDWAWLLTRGRAVASDATGRAERFVGTNQNITDLKRAEDELRQLTVGGVIRPEDISNVNEINYDKIAEARIAYGGKGTLSDVQQPRFGQQVYDIFFPF